MKIIVHVTLPDRTRREFNADLQDGLSFGEIDDECVRLTAERFGDDAIMECWTTLEE